MGGGSGTAIAGDSRSGERAGVCACVGETVEDGEGRVADEGGHGVDGVVRSSSTSLRSIDAINSLGSIRV